MWLSLPLNRIGLTLMLSSFVLLSPEGAQAVPCDPDKETIASVRSSLRGQLIGTPTADDPVSYPVPVTALELLQAIDASDKYLVVLPSGKPLAEQQLAEQDVGELHVFGSDGWKSPAVSMHMLQTLGWNIEVAPAGVILRNTSSTRARGARSNSGGPSFRIVFAHPPKNQPEDSFQTAVIPLKDADLYEVVEALRAMPPGNKRISYFTVIPSQTTNSVVLITTESFVIKRCEQLIEQMEATANKQQVSAEPEVPTATEEESLNLEELVAKEPLVCEEIEATFDSTSNIIAQIITEMQNSSAKTEILSASNSKRVTDSFTIHSYVAQFANNSIGNHLAFIEKISTRAPHLVFDLLEIKNNAKKNSKDADLCSLKLRLTNYSGVKSETESE